MTTRTRRGKRCLPRHRCVSLTYLIRHPLRFFPAQPNPQKSRSQLVIAAPTVAPATTTASQQHSIVPAPPAAGLGVASTSTSVSPSPFAPPSTSIPRPVFQSQPLPSSSSPSTHLTAKAKSPDVVRVHHDQPALSSDLVADGHPARSEYVMEQTSVSTLHPDDGSAGPGGNSTVSHIDAFTHDPLDLPQPRVPSRQVCLSSRAVLLSARAYPYVSCDRV